MANPSRKLAESLQLLQGFQGEGGVAIRSSWLPRSHRERLVGQGFLKEVMKGWYIPSRPDESEGETTSWYASYWRFVSEYLDERFGDGWSLNPEQSLRIHVGNRTVPVQLLVRSPRARNRMTGLMHGTSIFEVRASLPNPKELVIMDGLRLFSLSAGLIHCHPEFFTRDRTDALAALLMAGDSSEILGPLLEGGHTAAAGRLAGAFRNAGRQRLGDEIVDGMRSADFTVRVTDPFKETIRWPTPLVSKSSRAALYRVMWSDMREQVLDVFPSAPGIPLDIEAYLRQVADNYASDAYNSLSIEGYRVDAELVERVRSGHWNPDVDDDDRARRDAMAARGYWQAFQAVQKSVRRILKGADPGLTADEDHGGWYREMFAPAVAAGIVKVSDLAGYRDLQVFIRRSSHIPPKPEAVREAMPVLFELLSEESEASVRAVLGHFLFVYIHPYRDGNGRIGRFLMNVMMASGGYPWTIVPFSRRREYMSTLEQASVGRDIRPFATFLAGLIG